MPPPTWQTLVLHNNRRVENWPAAQSALLDAPVVGTSGSGEAGDLNSYPRRASLPAVRLVAITRREDLY